ncbi:hypothetical protein GCM10017044_16660 [Kordiimonas sediminis]|uniref:MAPEG family protein n=1 Tax=Kordiimonas sediminis TaxID=1735581 RepID=A0A919AST4_9PROT|nr:MAPEG family protein [Kordiimonas sediminis]GHF22935.1 hypothetical protein GCM10017044_16660 [Kordiimonas sediminis]
MSVELTMLLWSVILYFILIMIAARLALKENGVQAQAGPRDNLPEPSDTLKRYRRLASNMQENLLMFGLLVGIASAADISTSLTVLGAQLFFYARCAHAVIYIAGWPMVRPLAWISGVVGMGMIAYALF